MEAESVSETLLGEVAYGAFGMAKVDSIHYPDIFWKDFGPFVISSGDNETINASYGW